MLAFWAEQGACDQREAAEAVDFDFREIPRPGVENAKGADSEAVIGFDRRAGVEAKMRMTLDIGHARQFRMALQVRDDDEVVGIDDAGADGEIARALGELHSGLAGDPLPILVDDVDGGKGRAEDAAGELGQGGKFRRRTAARGIQGANSEQSFSFIGGEPDNLSHSKPPSSVTNCLNMMP